MAIEYDEILLNFSSRVDAKGLKSAVNSLEKLKDINGFSGLQQAGQDLKGFIQALDGISHKRLQAITDLANSLKGLGGVKKTMKAISDSMAESNPMSDLTQGTAPQPKLEPIEPPVEKANAFKDAIASAYAKWKDFVASMKEAESPLSKLANRFKRFLEYRAMRAVWSAMVNGIKEGFSNLEAWDRRLGDTGFAESMDRARESLLVLKNSLAVVGAPFLEYAISMLQQVAQWAMAGANAVSRLIAILGGQSSYRAVKWADYTANAVKGTTGAVKDLNKEFKKQLMGFDEINNITEQNGNKGGGGYGNSGYFNYDDMFEELEVGELSEWEKKIKAIADSLKPVWDWLKKIGSELSPIFSKLKMLGDPLRTIWDTTVSVVKATLEWIGEFMSPAWQGFKYILDSIVGLFVSLGKLLGNVYKAFGSVVKAVGNLTSALGLFKVAGVTVQVLLTALGVAIDVVTASILVISTAFEQLSLNIEFVSTVFSNFKALLRGEIGWKEFKQNLADAKKELDEGLAKSTAKLKDDLNAIFDKKYKLDIDASALDKFSGVGVTSKTGANNKPMMFLEAKAQGGYVDQGQLFIAREAGAELVGNIGGHTGVANNQDIVASVSQGVAQAVASVLGNGTTNVTVSLEGDAKGLFKAVQKESRAYSARTGQPAMA